MAENRHGQVVTFYSYNGGTGRTMAIANVAWILAASGRRVLIADWDLESPGLHRFFGPFISASEFARTGGVTDLIREFEWATIKETERPANWYEQYAQVRNYCFPLSWDFPSGGTLDFLSAGRQNTDYAASIQGLDWDMFYEHLGGGQFLDALRADMKFHYDYALIDSRTGVSDVAEICTVQLPDVLVACFTLSEQSMDGAATVARLVQQRYDARNIRILPVPMRVELIESSKVDVARLVSMRRFAGLPADLSDDERVEYWTRMQIPYQPFYAYEEILATFADEPGSARLLPAYETLARYISAGAVTALPPVDEEVRRRTAELFTRRISGIPDDPGSPRQARPGSR
jgi:MinD-like ATPase involved in chromosome partitioning or flagellar assembly